MVKPSEIKKLQLLALQKVGGKVAEEYGFYDGSLLVLIEDLMPFLKQAGIGKKEWLSTQQK